MDTPLVLTEVHLTYLNNLLKISISTNKTNSTSNPNYNLVTFNVRGLEIEIEFDEVVNFKKSVKELKREADLTSLNMSNELHISWMCMLVLEKFFCVSIKRKQKVCISANDYIVGYYTLKSLALGQMQWATKSDFCMHFPPENKFQSDVSFEKKSFLRKSIFEEINEMLSRQQEFGEFNKEVENLPKFSLVIPTLFRNANYLRLCITSVVKSSVHPAEIIFVVPNKAYFEEQFLSKIFMPIKCRTIEENTRGIGFARKLGAESASEELVSFVDDDDEVEKYFFERLLIAHSVDHELSAIGCWLKSFGSTSNNIPQFDNLPYLGVINCSPSAGILMWKKNVLIELGNFDPIFTDGFEDFDLSSRAAAIGRKVRVIDQCLYRYRRHAASTTSSYTDFLQSEKRSLIIAKTSNANPHLLPTIVNLLFANGNSIKDESPFYWESPANIRGSKKLTYLFLIYGKLPYKTKRRIYDFIKSL